MKKILIHNDNGRRDLLGLRLLERSLVAAGFKVYFSGRHALIARLRRIQPDALIMARGDNPAAKMASAVCPVYVLPGEGGRTTKETTLSVFLGRARAREEVRAADWIRRCYLWNENTRDWLLETGLLTPSQVKVVGNPRMDIYRCAKRAEMFRKRAANTPLRVGIAFSATTTSQIFGHQHFAEVYHDVIKKDYVLPIVPPGRSLEDLVWRDHAILRNMMHVIGEIGQRTSFETVLRPNPLESISEYRFLEKRYPGRFRLKFRETLPEFLAGIDVLLTCWSTTGIEALLNEIPVIGITGLVDQDRLFDHVAKVPSGFESYVRHYHTPNSLDGLIDLLRLADAGTLAPSPKPPAETASMLREIYGWMPEQRPSCDLIAEDIASDLASLERPAANASGWRKSLPLKYNLPPLIAELGINARDLWKAARSGDFHSYMSFLSCNDPYVSRLLAKVL